jgi:hypothetical protein
MADESCMLPGKNARGLFTRLNRHHLSRVPTPWQKGGR